MGDVLSWPMDRVAPAAPLSSLWEIPSPHSPLAFWALEEEAQRTAREMSDQILGHHLRQVHHEGAFVRQAVQQARERSPVPLVNKGLKAVSVRLPGGTRVVVQTPYLLVKPGRKRTKRGPKGIGRYPVLEALGIHDRVSPATRSQIALYTVQAGSYQEALLLLEERGLSVDWSILLRVAQSTAQAHISLRDTALATAQAMPVVENGPLAGKRVRVSLDGGRVRTRQTRRGRKTDTGRHRFDTPWREPRVLVIDILDAKGRADKLRLPLYDVLLDDADATFALVLGYLRLLGAAHALIIEFIADGADWIWDRSETLRRDAEIPPDRWVEVVDFYHASEHLSAAVELCRSMSRAEREGLFEGLRHLLRRDPHGVACVVERLLSEAKGRRATPMKKALVYFEKHAHRMAYPVLDAQHLPVGSGVVESAVRRIINLRFKASGSFWEADTVADLMHLRACFKAGRWHEMMERILTQEFVLPDFEPLSPEQIQGRIPLDPLEKEDPEEGALEAAELPILC